MDVIQSTFQPPLQVLEDPPAPFKMHYQQQQQEQSLIQSSDQIQQQLRSEYDKNEPNCIQDREESPSYYKHVLGNLENGDPFHVKLENIDEIGNCPIESSIISGGISMNMKNECLSPILNITNTNGADTSSVQEIHKTCNVSSRFESSNTNVVQMMAAPVSATDLSKSTNPGIIRHTDVPVMNQNQIYGYTVKEPLGVVATNDRPSTTPHTEVILEGAKKREIRLYKNREAAKECRNKKKEYVKCLENRVAVLENQNKALIEELKSLKDLYCRR